MVLSGNKYPTAPLYFTYICQIREELIKWNKSDDENIKKMSFLMQKKFDKYWKECNMVLTIAVILDPRYKITLIEAAFSTMYDKYASIYIEKVRKFWVGLLLEYEANSSVTSNSCVSSFSRDMVVERLNSTNSLLTRFKELAAQSNAVVTNKKNEIDLYLEEGLVPFSDEETGTFDILSWWKHNGVKFPGLSMMARDILAIPCTAVPSGSTFSQARRIIDDTRASLLSETAETLLCVKDWLPLIEIDGMRISSRKDEPAHYMLKIENFSLLSDAGMIKFESDVFEATGYKWRLDLYPNGNKKEKVDNHVSLYVIICDTESLPKGWEVQVDVNFFIYDHNGHIYVTFQDADGNRTRFHEKKIQWGFHKLISLDSLKENENGYLFNDSFVFGAEIFSVSKYVQKDRCFSMIKPPATINSYTWKIDKFSDVTEELLYSEVFKVGKVKWKLLLYPGGNKSEKGTSLSIYLKVHDAALLPDGWRVYAKYKIRVKNQSGDADIEEETENSFCISKDDWGFSCFMTLSELRDVTKGFLVNDVLVVEADISIMGILKDNI